MKKTPKKLQKTKRIPLKIPKNTQLITPKKIGRPIEWTPERIEAERIALEKWIDNPKNYFFTAFLNERHLDLKQVERFAEVSPTFCHTYAHAKQIQEARLVELAVSRKGDGNFIKFVLQNKAGWKEKSEVSGNGTNPLAIILDRIGANARDPLEYDDE